MSDWEEWRALLAATDESQSQPERICELCTQRLDISGAGLSMVTPSGSRGIVCSTDEVSARLEDLQFTLGEGPCFDAARSGSPILISDLDETDDLAIERWPTFLAVRSPLGPGLSSSSLCVSARSASAPWTFIATASET